MLFVVCLGENFLTSMVYSNDRDIREKAIEKIIQLKNNPISAKVMKVKPQDLNFSASPWSEMIQLDT